MCIYALVTCVSYQRETHFSVYCTAVFTTRKVYILVWLLILSTQETAKEHQMRVAKIKNR
jgi:hypothetical protein